MIGLDTNVLVRYAVQDDEEQAAAARRLIDGLTEDTPGFISILALAESVWVLQRAYSADRKMVTDYVARLLSSRELRVQAADVVRGVLRDIAGSNAEFSDSLIALLGTEAECEYTATFDRKAAAALPGMKLLT